MHDDAPTPAPADLSPQESPAAPAARPKAKRAPPAPAPSAPGAAAWVSLAAAAAHLGTNPDALRRLFERRARRAADGVTEADIDGVRARRLGRLWRVRFSPAWLSGDARRSPARAAGNADDRSASNV